MLPFVLLFSAVVPGLLLVWYFHSRDASPVSARRLWATFAYGCVCAIPAVFLASIFRKFFGVDGGLAGAAFKSFIEAGLAEETAKLSVLMFFSLRVSRFTDPMDGLVYGATASLGFATLENVLYVAENGFGTAIVRAVLSVPGHAFFGAIMGYFVGRARTLPAGTSVVPLTLRGLAVAVILHGLYDFGLFGAGAVAEKRPGQSLSDGQVMLALALLGVTITAFISAWWLTARFVRKLRAEQDADPYHHIRNASEEHIPPPPQKRGNPLRWLWLLLGGLMATAGGLLLLLALFSPVIAQHGDEPRAIFAFCMIFGLPPFILGIFLFRLGLRS